MRIRQAEQFMLLALLAMFVVSVAVYRISLIDLERMLEESRQRAVNQHLAPNNIRQQRQAQAQQQSSLSSSYSYSSDSLFQPIKPASKWELTYYGPDEGIFDFDPSRHPIFPDWLASTDQKKKRTIQTRLFTEKFGNRRLIPMNECKHILFDGLDRSEIFDLKDVVYTDQGVLLQGGMANAEHDELWVLDIHHLLGSCDKVAELMRENLERRHGVPWKVLAVDFADERTLNDCTNLPAVIGKEHYRLSKRSIVDNRQWSEELQFPSPGNFLEQPTDAYGGPVLHSPYPVRSDIVQAVAASLATKGLATPLQTVRDETDAAHYYKRQFAGGIKAYYDNLRNGANIVMHLLHGSVLLPGRGPLRMVGGLIGADKRKGRNGASLEYVESLLSTKIVVVCQRDSWVDHYRLLEAMTGGAMVIADTTQILPRGLRDGESVVLFHSFSDLREKLLYYLHPNHDQERMDIAKRGWEIAMGYQRSWHLLETTIVGKPMTEVNKPYEAMAEEIRTATTST